MSAATNALRVTSSPCSSETVRMVTSVSIDSMPRIVPTAEQGVNSQGRGEGLSSTDYSAMADAAGEFARMSKGARREYNKALQEYYRALSVRDSVAAEVREAMNPNQYGA